MTVDPLRRFTIEFTSYEAREEAFNRRVSHLIPCKYAGPAHFWKAFLQITQAQINIPKRLETAYITANPRDCLAFGTPHQVLSATGMLISREAGAVATKVAATARKYELEHLLTQPIRTLSGGETVKLALAKVYLAGTDVQTDRLAIASPFCWLSHTNTGLLERTVSHYTQCGLPVEILALEGEQSRNPISGEYDRFLDFRVPVFDLHLEGVRIPLGTVINTVTDEPEFAVVEDALLSLSSPCLLVGDNGQGKSLLAKALAKAIDYEGSAQIRLSNQTGRDKVRLLFQDVLTQTMLRSRTAIIKSVRAWDAGQLEIDAIYQRLQADFLKIAAISSPDAFAGEASLIEVKLALAAVRLCGRPKALILDEPDWGLTRRWAIAFVLALIRTADHLGVPVVLISHKPWWRPLAASLIRVVKKAPRSGEMETGSVRFRIKVARHRAAKGENELAP
jgi:energy-coupling factor transporter ATP-binding protein EcfA2